MIEAEPNASVTGQMKLSTCTLAHGFLTHRHARAAQRTQTFQKELHSLMHKLRLLSQQRISLFIALYLGILLNLPIFFRRFGQLHYDNLLSIAVEMLASFALVYFLTLLVSFTGKTVPPAAQPDCYLVSGGQLLHDFVQRRYRLRHSGGGAGVRLH